MTEQEHLEISRQLALAIGWKPEQIKTIGSALFVEFDKTCDKVHQWRTFDYRDEVIAFRVAEKFDCFPSFNGIDTWCTVASQADTPQLAIALAVIAAKGVK